MCHISMRAGFVGTRVTGVAGATRARAKADARHARVSRPAAAVRVERGGVRARESGEEVGRSLQTGQRAFVAFGVAACLACGVAAPAALAQSRDEFYIEDIPQGLSSGDTGAKGQSLSSLVRGANTKEIEKCAGKCIVTCTRGGGGAPGLGPLSVRKAPVVFKEGFRSRQYCLNECTEICSITVNGSKSGR
jgi:hypothetical protein